MQDWPTSLQQLVQAFGLRPVSGQAEPGGYSGTYADRKAQIHNDWLYRWYDRTKDVATGYRTEGRRRSENVIDARWNVPGETPEQQAARLWHAHERGVDRVANTMIPTVISRNPALEGKKAEPLFFEGSDRLIPTVADLERIMAGARGR